ncbi:uncharacterized protein LOC120519572, partial [Polypterus senegalus]|uniref:uncharacterized protein LOC120519572 n=1 Tax=Polypterus senegalus TaxID=55291 RepID=UPI001965534B
MPHSTHNVLTRTTESILSTAETKTSSHSISSQICTDNDCNGSPSLFNSSSGTCQCQCPDFTIGGKCLTGKNYTDVTFGVNQSLPTLDINIIIIIDKTFPDSLKNSTSSLYQKFSNIIIKQLTEICKPAAEANFQGIEIIQFTKGSIRAESIVKYEYRNNQSDIDFLNNVVTVELNKTLHNNSFSLISNFSKATTTLDHFGYSESIK